MARSEGYVFGRPTKYKKEYCEMLVEHMGKGYSFESFSATIGTHRDTLYEWAKVHKNFSDAKKLGREASLLFFEKMGVGGMSGKLKGFNASSWIFTVKNRHYDMYSDTINVEQDDRTVTIAYVPKSKRLED